jgi:integrating conjugative element protein (TIGR03757 family)
VVSLHLLVTTPAASEPASVQVFTTAHLPALQRLDRATRVCVLDAFEAPLKTLSFPYPGSEEGARRQAVSMINSPRGQAALDALRRAAEAAALAWQSGIQRLPAILVDQRYVVYGEYDVQVALERVADFRARGDRAGESDEPEIRHVP